MVVFCTIERTEEYIQLHFHPSPNNFRVIWVLFSLAFGFMLEHTLDCREIGAYDATPWSILFCFIFYLDLGSWFNALLLQILW